MITNVGGKCKVCGQQKRTVLSFRDVFYECDCKAEKATKTYNKLVRDKIPEIIKLNGEVPVVRALSYDEYVNALDSKLIEEIDEYKESKDVEELTDILEVVYAIARTKNITALELNMMRFDKAHRCGTFENKVFLESVTGR